MRNLILFIAFSFTSLFAIDCNSMSSVKSFNGHYYAKTNTRTSYDTIRVSAVNDKAYLAIPNSAEENAFIKSLVGGNTEAWIGVFDPNHAKNYCYDNATCFFDDSRFRDVKGQVITYRNWASYEPNNFVESSDIENNLAVVDPLGENWVIMNGNTGQWYDVGNHKSSNQNPRNHVAIVEFDEKPICVNESDGVTDTNFPQRVCNTQVFDDNIANADKGTTANCLFDINGKEYCPQGLADAASYWSYIQGDSLKKISSVTDYAQGQYAKFTKTVRDFANSTSTRNTGTVVDYDIGNYREFIGVVTDYTTRDTIYQTATPNVGGTWTYDYGNCDTCKAMPISNVQNMIRAAGGTGNNIVNVGCTYTIFGSAGRCTSCSLINCNSIVCDNESCWNEYDVTKGVLNDSSKTVRIGINSTYINIYPGQIAVVGYKMISNATTGEYKKSTGKPQMHLAADLSCNNWATAPGTKDYPAHVYCADKGNGNTSCPAGYTMGINAAGATYCYIASFTCPTDYFNDGTYCRKDVNYKYYSYGCEAGYTIGNRGFTSFTKTDPDTTRINWDTLDDSVNNINPPAGNCTKVINYNYYTYGCETGYTAINKGLTTCTRTDTSNTGVNSSLASDCNSPTPPTANCYKDISYNYYTYSCPAGYSIANYGLTSCPKTDPDEAINNQTTLDDDCNNPTPPVGNCSKSIDYAYYQYVCSGATNSFNQPYTAVDTGLTSCTKTDTDKVNTNSELANSCNSATPPTNNCRTTEYTCNSQVREPVWIDNKWQCSPYPCYGNNNVEDLSQNVGTLDKNDNGWTEQGKCSGTIYIFNGTAKQCRSSDKFFGLTGGGCCKDDKTAMGLLSCNAEEKELRLKKEAKKCHYIGEYCSKKINIGVAKICVRTSKSYCCFNSTLGRIIAEQGRAQLKDIDWGTASNPNCRGFTVEEFQRLDLSQMDLTEFTNSIQLPNVENKQTEIIQKINNHLNLIR
jgi:conjugal transfer mating pair stabilization protein TraN